MPLALLIRSRCKNLLQNAMRVAQLLVGSLKGRVNDLHARVGQLV